MIITFLITFYILTVLIARKLFIIREWPLDIGAIVFSIIPLFNIITCIILFLMVYENKLVKLFFGRD